MLKNLLLSAGTVAVAGLSPACFSPALAQDIPESVIVTATRVPTPQAQVASSITIVTAADIAAQQAVSVPDVLDDLPGLNVVQTGGPGGQTSIFMRGASSNHTKVLLDGIDMSDPSNPNGSADVSKLLTGDIARVEVLRGPQSGLYGSDAIGGVINIITKSGEGAPKFTGSLEAGSFDTFNQKAGVSGSSGAFHFAATLDHVHAGDTPVTPLNLLLPGEARNDDYFDGVTASTKLGYDVTRNFDLGFAGHYGNSLARITSDAFDPVTFASYPSPHQTRIDTLQYDARGTAHLVLGGIDQALGLAYSSTVTQDLDPDNGSFPSSGDRIKLDWQGNIALVDDELLVLGAETARDAIHVPLSAGTTTNAGFAELQSTLGAFSNSINLRYDDNSRFGGKVTYRIAPTYLVEETGTRLKASFGTGFKAPSLEDLFQDFPAFSFFANPNLKPETSTGYDFGIEQSLGALQAGATWFHNGIRNLIASNGSFTHGMDVNIGRATTQGLESFISWQARNDLKLRADYTYTEATDDILHQELTLRPRHKTSLIADWQALDSLSLHASLLYVGPMIDNNRDFSVPRLATPGVATVDIAARYKLNETLLLYGRVDNLLDKHYENPIGFLRPGRGLYAGIEARF